MTEAARATVVARIADIDADAWNACTVGDPFTSHAFLHALEETGCAVKKSGWLPQHVVVEDEHGIVAAAPAYLKTHSYGEYVFDWGWADAYRRIGKRYYPKLQCSVPFTPVTGSRLLVRPGADLARSRATVLSALIELARHHQASSLHVTFPTRDEWDLGGDLGLLQRTGIQFHWHNRGYASFDDFLGELLGRKKRQIQRERREACDGVAIETLRGDDIREAHWDAFYDFYRDTIERKWGQAYLARSFFEAIGETMGDRVALMIAKQRDRIIAGALNLLGPDALFGRYWGAAGDHPFLHFELCYYRAIDLAIELGLSRVEAGAQGEHKLARGYVPVETHSLHWIADRELGTAIGDFVHRERAAVRAEIAELTAQSPYPSDRGLRAQP
jgi:predicted N-acyltransferase